MTSSLTLIVGCPFTSQTIRNTKAVTMCKPTLRKAALERSVSSFRGMITLSRNPMQGIIIKRRRSNFMMLRN
jgi:hypothetical protein